MEMYAQEKNDLNHSGYGLCASEENLSSPCLCFSLFFPSLCHPNVIRYFLCRETCRTTKDDRHDFHFFYIRKKVLKLKKNPSQPAAEWEAVS